LHPRLENREVPGEVGADGTTLPELRFRRFRDTIRLKADSLEELVERFSDILKSYSTLAGDNVIVVAQIIVEGSMGVREARVWITPERLYGVSNVSEGDMEERDFYNVIIEIFETNNELMRFDHEFLGYAGFKVEEEPRGREKLLLHKLFKIGAPQPQAGARAGAVQAAVEAETQGAAGGEAELEEEAPAPRGEQRPAPAGGPMDRCLQALSAYCDVGCTAEDPVRMLEEDYPVILYREGPAYVCVIPEKSEECSYRVIMMSDGYSERCLSYREAARLVDSLVKKEGFKLLRV